MKNRNYLYSIQRKIFPYLLISPFLILFVVFRLGTIPGMWWISMNAWKGTKVTAFVGVDNYLQILQDSRFWVALRNTVVFVFSYSAITIFLALVIALVINSTLWGSRTANIFQTWYIVPVCVSLAVSAFVFDLVYGKTSGTLNLILRVFRLPHNFRWLEDTQLTLWSIVMMRVWRVTGYYAVFLVAGIRSIPNDIYAASKMDGASSWQIFFYITLPLLKSMLLFVMIMATIWGIQVFDEPWILLKGGPADTTLTLQIYLYRQSFLYMRMGIGAGVAFIMALLMITVSVFYNRILGR